MNWIDNSTQSEIKSLSILTFEVIAVNESIDIIEFLEAILFIESIEFIEFIVVFDVIKVPRISLVITRLSNLLLRYW